MFAICNNEVVINFANVVEVFREGKVIKVTYHNGYAGSNENSGVVSDVVTIKIGNYSTVDFAKKVFKDFSLYCGAFSLYPRSRNIKTTGDFYCYNFAIDENNYVFDVPF